MYGGGFGSPFGASAGFGANTGFGGGFGQGFPAAGAGYGGYGGFGAGASAFGSPYAGAYGAPATQAAPAGAFPGSVLQGVPPQPPTVPAGAFGVPPPIGVPPAGAPPAAPQADSNHHHSAGLGQGEEWCGHMFYTLGYWKARGLASAVRMMFAFHNQEYENKFYTAKKNEDGSFDRSEWLTHKETDLRDNNPLVNLPYLEAVDETGGLILAQSNAILNHLARRFSLSGCSEINQAKADMLLDQCTDLRNNWTRLCYRSENFDVEKTQYFGDGGKFDEQISKFDDWLEANDTKFLVEEMHPITADFVFWELLDIHNTLESGCLDKFPRIRQFYDNFRALPQLQEYFKSELYQLPINGISAKCFNGLEEQQEN